jgi:hypothetical protein
MKNKQFTNYPDTTIHVLKVSQWGKEAVFFKSKSLQKLQNALDSLNYDDYSIQSFTCKDTFESDESHELCGIKSFVGEYL